MRLGGHHTAETKKKMSLAHQNPFFSEEHRNNIAKALRGRRFTEEWRRNLSQSLLGRKAWDKGKKLSAEHCKKLSESHKNPDREAVRRNLRNDGAYLEWRRKIVKRDKGFCGLASDSCSGHNIVHHILPWAQYPEERYNINNGITLCQYHHPRTRKDEQRLIPTLQSLVGSN